MTILNINNKRPIFLIRLLLFSILFFSECRNRKVFLKKYYAGTTILKSEGYYISDLPIDTIKSYSREGWLESIDVYTANGLLNGECKSFYKNGIPSEVINYVNGSENGKSVAYRENGTMKLVGFFFNGLPMGDAYYLDTLNLLYIYNFLDFHNKPLMFCKYNSEGKIVEGDNFDFYFIDSLQVAKGDNGKDTIKTLLLISHQPKTSMRVRIDNVGREGRVINSIIVDADRQLVYYNNLIDKEVDTIKEIGVRYDSLLNKSKRFTIEKLTKYLR